MGVELAAGMSEKQVPSASLGRTSKNKGEKQILRFAQNDTSKGVGEWRKKYLGG